MKNINKRYTTNKGNRIIQEGFTGSKELFLNFQKKIMILNKIQFYISMIVYYKNIILSKSVYALGSTVLN